MAGLSPESREKAMEARGYPTSSAPAQGGSSDQAREIQKSLVHKCHQPCSARCNRRSRPWLQEICPRNRKGRNRPTPLQPTRSSLTSKASENELKIIR